MGERGGGRVERWNNLQKSHGMSGEDEIGEYKWNGDNMGNQKNECCRNAAYGLERR